MRPGQDSDGVEFYYIDSAIPDLLVAIEFDGSAKYGFTEEERVIAWGDQFERERFLLNRGWTILRFTWADLDNPVLILDALERAAAEKGRRLPRCAKARIRAIP